MPYQSVYSLLHQALLTREVGFLKWTTPFQILLVREINPQNKILLGSLSPSLWLCLWKRYNLLVSPKQENAVVCNFCNQRFAQCADGKPHCFGTSGTFGFSKLFTLCSETFVRILILPISFTMLSNSTRLN